MKVLKKAILASAITASALTAASPAMARDYGYHSHGDAAGAAIAGGIIGLALGAVIASAASDRDHDDYRDRGWQYREGYYWDREGHRYDRNGRRYDDDNDLARRGYGDGYYGEHYYRSY